MSHGRKRKQEHNTRAGLQEKRMTRTLDKLAQFELFDKNIMPQLKKMVLENWPPEKIRKAFAPIMQAQMIRAGLQGNLTAIKDTLDRHEGMAVQRVNNVNVYARMDKRELAALALQKLLDAKIIDTTGQVIGDDEEDK
jgi:hypothetical protein